MGRGTVSAPQWRGKTFPLATLCLTRVQRRPNRQVWRHPLAPPPKIKRPTQRHQTNSQFWLVNWPDCRRNRRDGVSIKNRHHVTLVLVRHNLFGKTVSIHRFESLLKSKSTSRKVKDFQWIRCFFLNIFCRFRSPPLLTRYWEKEAQPVVGGRVSVTVR